MSKYHSADAYLLWDGYNLTGISTELALDIRAAIEDATTLGDSWREREYASLKEGELTQDGFYDSDPDAAFAALTGSGTGLALFEGNTAGKKAVGLSGAIQGGYSRRASIGVYHRAKGVFALSGIIEEGIIIAPLAAYDSDPAAVSGQDNSSSSADGGSGYLQVTELTLGGYDDIVVKIRDSADDITYGDLITFTAVTAAATDERKTASGTVEQYVDAEWAFTGSGSGESATFIVVFKRN
jgi:hypothetical protein